MYYNKEELTLLYNSKNARDQKTLALATTIAPRVNKQDVASVHVSATLFEMLVDKLGGDAKALLETSLPLYQEVLEGHDYTTYNYFIALLKHPELLRCPVACFKGHAIFCETPSDVLKLDEPVNA